MKRLAVLLLAGATFVAAQTDVTTQADVKGKDQEMEKLRIQLQEKLKIALDNAGEKVEKAKECAMRYQKELEGKTPEEKEKIMEQKRKEAHERLQRAIEALDKASEKVNAQIEEVRERIQKRLQEKKEELIQLQERIRAREQAREEARKKMIEGEGSKEGYGSYGEGGKPPVVPPIEKPEKPEFGGPKSGEKTN